MDHQDFAQLLGNYGEFLGAIAVVATLVYLAQQIRNQNKANEIATFEGLMDGLNQLNSMLAADKALYRTFITGLNRPDELEDDEAGSFSFLFRMYANSCNKVYRAYQRGAIEEQLWKAFAGEAAELLESPGGHAFFEGHSEEWEYVQAMRKHLREDSVVDISLGREALRRGGLA